MKSLKYEVEIKGQKVRYTNKLNWVINYEFKDEQTDKAKIDMIDAIIKRAITFAIENAIKKGFMYQFDFNRFHIEQKFDDLKPTVRREQKLISNTSITKAECEISGETTWCKPKILTNALIWYFNNYFNYLKDVANASNKMLSRSPNFEQRRTEFESKALSIYQKCEENADNTVKALIGIL